MITDWDDAYANGPHIEGAADYPTRWVERAEAFRQSLGERAQARGRRARERRRPRGPDRYAHVLRVGPPRPGQLSADPEVPAAIAALYPGRTLILSDAEKAGFVGNCLAITERDVLLSKTAAETLRPASRAALESWGFTLRVVDASEFEKAGGSVRCMTCEIF